MSEHGSAEDSTPGGLGLPALADIRVLDLSQVAAGPYLASLLGDLGAAVIKVEPPFGEMSRTIDSDFDVGHSAYFFGMTRSKRSISLDLKNATDARRFRVLVESADVVLVSMRAEALKRL